MADSCKMMLPDGRNVELCSREGSDAFLTYATSGPINWFAKNIEMCDAIRRRERSQGGNMPAEAKNQLLSTYFIIDSLAGYSTPSLFAEKVPTRDIRVWLDHVIAQLRIKGRDPRWRRTGTLERHDAFIINPCVPMFVHASAAQLAIEGGFFKVLADFVGATDGVMPCPDIAETLCLLTVNAFMSLKINVRDNPWPAEKIFERMASSGWLAWFIRCTSIPQKDVPMEVYDEMMTCPGFAREKLRAGEPSGDAIRTVLTETGGGRRQRSNIVQKLRAVLSFVELLQPGDAGEMDGSLKMCRKCNKAEASQEFQKSLKLCSRCRGAYYCSTECQKKDWKQHKKQCRQATANVTNHREMLQQIVLNYAKKHYIPIMVKVVECCDEKGLAKSDVLLELDFVPDGSGVAPALSFPPSIVVKEARGYYEGARPNEPDWFYKNADDEAYNTNVQQLLLGGLADYHRRMTDDQLLCFVRDPEYTAAYRMQLCGNGAQMFGEVAFNAFREAIQDDDFTSLTRIYGDSMADLVRQYLKLAAEKEFERIRLVANAMGLMRKYGAFILLFAVAMGGVALSMAARYFMG